MIKLKFAPSSDEPAGCLIFIIALSIYVPVAWVVNLVKLLNCDFAPIDKHEIIHLIGLIPGVSMITCWF